MGFRRLRRGIVLLALACLVGAAHFQARALQAPAQGEARAVLGSVLSPGEIAAAALLGGLRSIAVDIAWIRAFQFLEEQRFEEMGVVCSALEVLQAGSPSLYRIQSEQMALDIPRLLPHRPEERWMWIRRGLEVLERGSERFPGNLSLLRQTGFLYYIRFHPVRSASDRKRFLEERRREGERVPYGEDPLEIARKAAEKASEIQGHGFEIDRLLWAIYALSYSLESGAGRGGKEILFRAERLLDHAAKVHSGVPELKVFLESGRKRLDEGWRVEEGRK